MRRLALVLSAALVAAAVPTLAPITSVASAAPPAADQPVADQPASVPGELLVGYDPGTSAGDRAAARGESGARLVERVVQGDATRREVELVALPGGADRDEAIQRFERNPNVAYAEPNWIVTHQATSNDPKYTDGSLWGMYGDASSPANQYGSQAGEAWAAGNTGSGSVVVGVIDEGIDTSHPDLAANIWKNPGEVAGNGVDDDGNGYVDDINGWDFVNGDGTVYDGGNGDKHGTHVAGTIAGVGGNGQGVAGMAWNATLISAKFLGPNGGTTANAVKAVDYLTDLKNKGINVVASNNSWGGGGFTQTLYDAIVRADTAGILFVAAAGNGGSDGVGDDNDTTAHYPSSYANPNVISVASITSDGAKSGFSNYGETSVDLGAPGSGIWSTLPGNNYGSYNGTSMATPHVTGGIVLAATQTPTLDAAQLREAVLSKVAPTDSLTGITAKGGRLDVSAFGSISTPTENRTPTATDDAYKTPQNTTLSIDAPGVLDNDKDLDGDRLSATLADPPSHGTVTVNAGGSFTYKPNRKFTGDDQFHYTADDGRGGSSTATVTVTVEASTGGTKGKPTPRQTAR